MFTLTWITEKELERVIENKRDEFCWKKNMKIQRGCETRGTLRSDNGDVHGNIDEKQTSPHFKLFRDYPSSPWEEGDFGWS